MTYTIGIDLGTTYSAAAVHANGVTEMVSLGHRATIVPSAVFVTESGEVLVGEAALRRGATEPERLCREFKRRIGDSVPLIVGGSPFSAEALTARLLRWIVSTVTEQRGEQPDRIVLTYPANWGAFKQERLTQAIRIAELAEVVGDADRVQTITEPEAAAISYASTERVPVGEVIAVYDLGGGTFDAAVLRKTDDGFEMLGSPEGIERLGGIDVDEAIFSHVRRALGDSMDKLDTEDLGVCRAVARLRSDCVEAKEALSSDTQASIPVLLPNLHTEVRLTRSELEGMVRPVLDDTVGALRRAIASTGLAPAEVDRVLLVGGSSRIPLVAQLVAEALGRPFFVDAHPKHAVALGAALSAVGGTALTPPHGIPVVPDPVVAEPVVPAVEAPVVQAPAPAPAPTPAPAPAPVTRTRPSARKPDNGGPSKGRIAAIVGVVAVVAVAAVLATRGGGDGGGGDDDRNDNTTSTTAVPELTLATPIPVGDFPDGVAVEGDNLWVATTNGLSYQRLDLATGAVEETFPLEGQPLAAAVVEGSLWVTQRSADLVARIDPASADVIVSIPVQDSPGVFSFGAGALWVGGIGGLGRIDPATDEFTIVRGDLGNVAGIAATDEVIWVSVYEENVVLALDPTSGEEKGRVEVGTNPDPVVVTSSGVWVGNRGDGTLMRVNPADFTVEQTLELPGGPTGMAVDDDRLWVITESADDAQGSLSLVDHEADEPTAVKSIEVGAGPLGVAVSPGKVWVTLKSADAVARVDVG